ncbi:hypothetical protein [Roseomonas marmotae]|uniref:Uncharacterized protein n=1 Tax=Roseomonas marmotae TaxID=2768161 RepID=A0ABS3K977_9PROT|nr:hypothetical protein [Roseomonas marmotae]MBO1074023.1 hypothetical protein [Roseomonas marmotae]QTI78810.1 hypothetical protein IAI58_14300 [Roseomonas marmotae]
MSEPIVVQRRILTADEFEVVSRSYYPAICSMERPELIALAKSLRQFHDKARDMARDRRRALRGKAEPRGLDPVGENGVTRKKEIFASALKRLNREIARQEDMARSRSQGGGGPEGLLMKRADMLRRHPAVRRAAGTQTRQDG